MKKLVTLAILALLFGVPRYSQAAADGTPSTGSFTIVNVSSLAQASATGNIAIISTAGSLGSRMSIGPLYLKEGRDWRVGASTAASAANLKSAINSRPTKVSASYSPGDTVITLTAIDVGTLYNSVGLRTSTPTALSVSGTFLTGGQDNSYIKINSVPLIQGRDWFIQDVASNTAINLAAGINHSVTLENQVEAVWLGGTSATVYLRSALSPVAYKLESSVPSDLTVSGPIMTGGSAGNLARSRCDLGWVQELPANNYPAGCTLILASDPATIYTSTKPVIGVEAPSAYWLGSPAGASSLNVLKTGDTMTGQLTLAGSTLTITGDAFSVGVSTLVVKEGKVGIGVIDPVILLALGDSDTGLSQGGNGILQIFADGVVAASAQTDGAGIRFFLTNVDDDASENPVCRSSAGELSRSSTGCNVSSKRYKQNIKDLDYGLEEVMRLRPVSYQKKTSPNRTQFGMVAEEVAEIFPEIIGYEPRDPTLIQTYDYRGMHAVLISAIQEQQKQIEDLRRRLKPKN